MQVSIEKNLACSSHVQAIQDMYLDILADRRSSIGGVPFKKIANQHSKMRSTKFKARCEKNDAEFL